MIFQEKERLLDIHVINFGFVSIGSKQKVDTKSHYYDMDFVGGSFDLS